MISCQISKYISKCIFSNLHQSPKDIPRYPFIFTFPVLPTCHSRSDRCEYVLPSRRPFWQQACPFLASWDHFRLCMPPTPTGDDAVSSLSCQPATATGMLPWARGLAVLYTTRMAAWTPSLGLLKLFLTALHHSQNQ